MTHTYDTKNRVSATSNPVNVSITPTSGATLLVLGMQIHEGTARTGGAPTFNGVALTQIGTVETAAETNCEMWYLLNPSIGTYNIVIPNTNTREVRAVGSVYKAQGGYASEFDVYDGIDLVRDNPSLTVVTTGDGCVLVDVMGNGQLTPPSASTHTELYSVDNGSDSDNHQYGLQTSAGEITLGWTESMDDWCMILAAFKEVAAGASATDLFDGKLVILDKVTSPVDGKVTIKDAVINLADGLVKVIEQVVGTADGKVKVKDSITGIFDGKVNVKDAVIGLFDGKLSIKDVTTNLADGKVKVKNTITGIFDGSVSVRDAATNLFDGTVRIKDTVVGLFDGKISVSSLLGKHEIVSISSHVCMSQELSSDITQSQEITSNIRQSISISSIVELE